MLSVGQSNDRYCVLFSACFWIVYSLIFYFFTLQHPSGQKPSAFSRDTVQQSFPVITCCSRLETNSWSARSCVLGRYVFFYIIDIILTIDIFICVHLCVRMISRKIKIEAERQTDRQREGQRLEEWWSSYSFRFLNQLVSDILFL